MTPQERATRIESFGFTNRQARFLVTVMEHSGVCLARQYCAFARIVRGQKMQNFFGRLLRRQFATALRCRQYGTRVYHLQHKPMYAAIRQGDNRHRRALTLAQALPRLMLLDVVLSSRETVWLGTEADKVAQFGTALRVDPRQLPALVFHGADGTQTTRFVPDKLPIGLSPAGDHFVLVYLAREELPIAFRLFLRRHAALLQRLPGWSVRVVLPPDYSQAGPLYRAAFNDEYASPLPPRHVDELRWYFEMKSSSARQSPTPDERYERAERAFSRPRFRSLYSAWRIDGDAVLDATLSHVLKSALDRGGGRLEIQTLPYRYDHISTYENHKRF